MPLYVVMVSGVKKEIAVSHEVSSTTGTVGVIRRRGSSQWLRQESIASMSSAGRSLFQRASELTISSSPAQADPNCRVVLTRIPELDALTKGSSSVRLPPDTSERELGRTITLSRTTQSLVITKDVKAGVLKAEKKFCKIRLSAAFPSDQVARMPVKVKQLLANAKKLNIEPQQFPNTEGRSLLMHCLACQKLMTVPSFYAHAPKCLQGQSNECPVCGDCRQQPGGLAQHVQRHLRLKQLRQPVSCPMCTVLLYNEHNLTLHELCIHV